jgi:serine/threonine protein kinase
VITNVGQRLGERYVLRERLAVGGMGEVWAALDEVLNRAVAVKVLRTDLAPDANFQARFRAEARTAAALSHGGIAAVYDYGEVAGSAYLVMELVPGDPLSAMIAEEGALGSERTLSIVSQAGRALHAAHQHGVIHRDIKPANLMITPELRVKVTDFGIARPRDHEPLTATGQVMGTAHYLAPELARGETASPLSDVYALGVVAYECLTGWRPFEGDNQVAVATAHLQDEPPPLPETIPAHIRSIVMSAMSKNPAKRPQGADALAELMEDARLRGLGGRSGSPEPVAASREASDWPTSAEAPQSGRRNAALDRAAGGAPSGGRPTAWESRGQRPREQDGYDNRDPRAPRDPRNDPRSEPRGQEPLADSGYAPGADFSYRRDPRSQPPQQQGQPPSGYRQQPGGYDQPQYDGRRPRPERPERPDPQRAAYAGGYDRGEEDPFSSLGSGGGAEYPSRSAARAGGNRSRANHGRGQAAGYPAENSSTGRPKRRLSIPLAALIGLVVLVVIVTLLAHRGNAATKSMGVPGLRSGHVTSSVIDASNNGVVTSVGIRG